MCVYLVQKLIKVHKRAVGLGGVPSSFSRFICSICMIDSIYNTDLQAVDPDSSEVVFICYWCFIVVLTFNSFNRLNYFLSLTPTLKSLRSTYGLRIMKITAGTSPKYSHRLWETWMHHTIQRIIHHIYSWSHKLLHRVPYDAMFSLSAVAGRQGESLFATLLVAIMVS